MDGYFVSIIFGSLSCVPILSPLLIGIGINTRRMRDGLSQISRIVLLKAAIVSWLLIFLGVTIYGDLGLAQSITSSLIAVCVIISMDIALTFYLGYRLWIAKAEEAIRFPWLVMGIDVLRLTNNAVFIIVPKLAGLILFLFLPTILALFGAIAVFLPPDELLQKQ